MSRIGGGDGHVTDLAVMDVVNVEHIIVCISYFSFVALHLFFPVFGVRG